MEHCRSGSRSHSVFFLFGGIGVFGGSQKSNPYAGTNRVRFKGFPRRQLFARRQFRRIGPAVSQPLAGDLPGICETMMVPRAAEVKGAPRPILAKRARLGPSNLDHGRVTGPKSDRK